MMPKHSQIRRLPYAQEVLFDLVLNVEKYPEFVPWCQGVEVHEKSEEHLVSTLYVGYGPFQEKFRTRASFTPLECIHSTYEEGPFKYLYNRWEFKRISPYQTDLYFFIEFQFKSMVLERTMELFFTKALQTMIQAFEDRIGGSPLQAERSSVGRRKM